MWVRHWDAQIAWGTAHAYEPFAQCRDAAPTAARILEELELSGWVRKHGKHYVLDLGRLEEPGYAELLGEVGDGLRLLRISFRTEHFRLRPTLTPKTK